MHLNALTSLPLLAVLLSASNARPTSNVVLEKIEDSPTGWVLDPSSDVDKDNTVISLKIHLTNQGMDEFHNLAMDVRALRHIREQFEPVANPMLRSRLQVIRNTETISITSRSCP